MKKKYILHINEVGDRYLYEDTDRFAIKGKKFAIDQTAYPCLQAEAWDDEGIDLRIGAGNHGVQKNGYAVIEVKTFTPEVTVIKTVRWATLLKRVKQMLSDGAETFSWQGVDIYWEDKYDCMAGRLAAA